MTPRGKRYADEIIAFSYFYEHTLCAPPPSADRIDSLLGTRPSRSKMIQKGSEETGGVAKKKDRSMGHVTSQVFARRVHSVTRVGLTVRGPFGKATPGFLKVRIQEMTRPILVSPLTLFGSPFFVFPPRAPLTGPLAPGYVPHLGNPLRCARRHPIEPNINVRT